MANKEKDQNTNAAPACFCDWCMRGLDSPTAVCGCPASVQGLAAISADPCRFVCRICGDPFYRDTDRSKAITPKHCGGHTCRQEFGRRMALRRYQKEGRSA